MLSYNCFVLLCQSENNLLQHAKQSIVQIEAEISHINTLIQDSAFLQLTPRDLDYYKKELEDIRCSNIELLHCITVFLDTVCKLASTTEQ